MLEEEKVKKLTMIHGEVDSDSYRSRRCIYSDKYSSNIDYRVDRVLAKHCKISRSNINIVRGLPWKQILGFVIALFIVLAAVPYVLPPLYGDFDSEKGL